MPTPAGRPLLVTTSPEEAHRESAAGRDVVLIVAPGAAGHRRAAGPGRVHRFVGDPADPGVGRAAAEMAAELGAVERRG